MRQMLSIWLILSACMFLNAGWRSTSSPPVIVPGPTPNEYTLTYGSPYTAIDQVNACANIIPFDGEAAYNRQLAAELAGGRNHPLLWTFMVNFDVLSPTGNPVGCLRFYHQVEPTKSSSGRGDFAAIDGGGILVDTCTADPSGVITLAGGKAIFHDEGFVQCEMNIQHWVESLTTFFNGLAENRRFSALAFELETFINPDALPPYPLHQYHSLTMVASATAITPPAGLGGSIDLPIIYYQDRAPVPLLGGWLWHYFDQSLFIRLKGQSVTFPVDHCSTSSTIGVNTPQIWWHDFGGAGSLYNWTYTYTTNTVYSYSYSCWTTSMPAPLLFTIGPATLYIGNTPTSKMFRGAIDGILIDPTDSIPPK